MFYQLVAHKRDMLQPPINTYMLPKHLSNRKCCSNTVWTKLIEILSYKKLANGCYLIKDTI